MAVADLEPMQGTETLTILQPLQTTVMLHSGNYTLFGTLETVARADPAPVASGQANADFFHSLSIGVNATPVPEPPALLQLSAGALVLFAWLAWQRTCGRPTTLRNAASHA